MSEVLAHLRLWTLNFSSYDFEYGWRKCSQDFGKKRGLVDDRDQERELNATRLREAGRCPRTTTPPPSSPCETVMEKAMFSWAVLPPL